MFNFILKCIIGLFNIVNMTYTKLPGTNGAGSQITATSTATSLQSLIRTAASSTTFDLSGDNFINLSLADGSAADIRYFFDGNTPTTAIGTLLEIGDKISHYGADLTKMLIISTGASSILDVAIGQFTNGQPPDNYGFGAVTLETGGAPISIAGTTPQALGRDAAGEDTYATVLTSVAAATHIDITLEGSNAAIISLDGGTTDDLYMAANSSKALDAITIAASTAVQAKNASAGNNYTNINITIW